MSEALHVHSGAAVGHDVHHDGDHHGHHHQSFIIEVYFQ